MRPIFRAKVINPAANFSWAVPGLLRMEYAGGHDGQEDECFLRPPARGSDWVVYLHGHSSKGDQLFTRADVRALWWPEIEKRGLGILSPTLRGNAWMGPAAAADLHDLLAEIRARYAARRFIFIGGSMGGTSCLIYAALHPADVAAVSAVCPGADLATYYPFLRRQNTGVYKEIADAIRDSYGGEPGERAALYAKHSAVANSKALTMPVFVAAATGDAIIPVDQARALASGMGDAMTFTYREQAGGDHESPLQAMPAGIELVVGLLRQ